MVDGCYSSKFLRISAPLSSRNISPRHEVRSSARWTSPFTMVKLISYLCHYDNVVISSQNIPQNNLKRIPDRKRFGRKSYSSYININGIAILWIKSIKFTSKAQNKVTHQIMVEM